MLLPITATVAALLTLMYLILTAFVFYGRQSGLGPGIGLGTNEIFIRLIRSHANFGEYTPLFLILLMLLELAGVTTLILSLLSAAFIVGRFAYLFGISFVEALRYRILGMILTITVLGLCALLLLRIVY